MEDYKYQLFIHGSNKSGGVITAYTLFAPVVGDVIKTSKGNFRVVRREYAVPTSSDEVEKQQFKEWWAIDVYVEAC